MSHFKPIFGSGSAKDLSVEVSIHFLPSEHLTTALMAPWWLCLALVLVCLSVHTSSPSCPSARSWPALIRVFILPRVCQQARRETPLLTHPVLSPSRMPMADKSPTSSGECKPLAFSLSPPPLYRPSVFLVECSFPFPFFFLLKQKKKSRPLIMICLS